jgi:hypothetical protein
MNGGVVRRHWSFNFVPEKKKEGCPLHFTTYFYDVTFSAWDDWQLTDFILLSIKTETFFCTI